MIEIEGASSFAVDCLADDWQCGAKAVCEKVTQKVCMMQNYDCLSGSAVSYYPEDGDGGDSFNVAAYPLQEDFGNICACQAENFQKYGVPQIYTPCGEGNWRFLP